MQTIITGTDAKYSVHVMCSTDRAEILRQLGTELYKAGYVKESYIEAVCKREMEFPTGLPMNGVCIAIPHADVSHVISEAMAVGVLEQPVQFQVMGSKDEFVDAQLVFMLAIKDPQAQLDMLQRLVEGCQDEQVLYMLRDHADVAAIDRIVKSFME